MRWRRALQHGRHAGPPRRRPPLRRRLRRRCRTGRCDRTGGTSCPGRTACADRRQARHQHRSVEQLEALKGVGPVRAKAIVKGRPYKGKDDLVRRKIVPQSVYDGISEQIIAKQK